VYQIVIYKGLDIKWGLCKCEILKENFKNFIEKTTGVSKEFFEKKTLAS
jgi:hypothetical protein